jgi:hypothetical protein
MVEFTRARGNTANFVDLPSPADDDRILVMRQERINL